jgi:hypothetical protein
MAKKMVFYEDREEAYYRPPTPKIESVPTPEFIEPDITWGNIPKPKPTTIEPQVRLYREPSASGGWVAASPSYPRITTQMPAQPISSTGWQYPREYSAAPVYFSPAELRASTGWQYPRELIQEYFGANRTLQVTEPKKSGLSVDWAGIWNRYLELYKKYYEGPTFDFAIQGPQEELYEPEQYVPQYEYAETPTYTIRYGGGGTPSSSRNYASNLINWRV